MPQADPTVLAVAREADVRQLLAALESRWFRKAVRELPGNALAQRIVVTSVRNA
jgi:hypothetical protein